MHRRKVCLIHTGGTIGMTRTAAGYAPQSDYLQTALQHISELQDQSMPVCDLIEFDPLLDSSNIAVNEWIKLARVIEANDAAYDGFVILHGTDTMAYTASALSFMLDGLKKPVIITGSQIPLCEVRNDARDNIISAVLIAAADLPIPEVCLYFGNKLFRGNRATKISSDELIAFDSPNFPPLAEAGVKIEVNRPLVLKPGTRLSVVPFSPQKIAVLKIFPGIQFDFFENLLSDHLGGLVLEAFGAGNIPESESLNHFLLKAKAHDTVIVVCTQCLRGSATIGQYETSSMLKTAGAVSGGDMTVEAAVTKLYYLLSLDLDRTTIKLKMNQNLRGEIS
ncbi:MAG: asparaginase [Eubacteriales bacterium]|nr:asparaginase [Eubacteriales bacterium]